MKFNSNWPEQKNIVVLPILCALFGAGLSLHVLNLSFFLLVIVALFRLVTRRAQSVPLREVYQSFKLLHWAMASMLVALILSQIGHGYLDLSPYNPIARLSIFVVLLWVMLNLPLNQLRHLQWAWVVGILLCAIQIYFTELDVNQPIRPIIENWYVALSSLLGVFSVLSLAWHERPGKWSVFLHLMGGFCGLYLIYICQTRGVWAALPLFIVMAYLTFVNNALKIKNIALLLIGIALCGILFFNTDLARNRMQQAEQDIQVFAVNKNAQSSIGGRLQLWKAALVMIREHPLIGVGSGEHYKAAMHDMVDRGVLPTYYNGAHTHNEILYSTATMGIPGLIAILLTYLVPGYYFAKSLLDLDRQTRAAAAMGFCVCAGFMIFGLVDVLFKYKEAEVFYCVSCALFFAFIISRKKQLQQEQEQKQTQSDR